METNTMTREDRQEEIIDIIECIRENDRMILDYDNKASICTDDEQQDIFYGRSNNIEEKNIKLLREVYNLV